MAKKETKLASRSEAKKEAPKAEKPAVTSAKAIAKDVRCTPRKARLLIDAVRGKDVSVALAILANTNKISAHDVAKVIKSAAANATNNFGMDANSLYVAEIYATDGVKMKRFLPRAKGSASGLVKRACHITVVVKAR